MANNISNLNTDKKIFMLVNGTFNSAELVNRDDPSS